MPMRHFRLQSRIRVHWFLFYIFLPSSLGCNASGSCPSIPETLPNPTDKATSSDSKPEVKTPPFPIILKNLHEVTYEAKLSVDDPEALIGQLIDALSSEDELVRFIATERLTELSPASVPQLIKALEHKHPAIVWGATLILGRLKEKRAVEPLVRQIRNPQPSIAVSFAGKIPESDMGEFQRSRSTEIGMNLLDRYLVTIWALGNIGSSGSLTVSDLSKFLGSISIPSDYPAARALMAWSLSRLGAAGKTYLVKHATNKNRGIRILGLKALGWVSEPNTRMLHVLGSALDGRDNRSRLAALQSLFHLLGSRPCDRMDIRYGATYRIQDIFCSPSAKPAIRKKVVEVLEGYFSRLEKEPSRIGADNTIDKISLNHRLLTENGIDTRRWLYALLKAPRICGSNTAVNVIQALSLIEDTSDIRKALEYSAQDCLLDNLNAINLDKPNVKNRGKTFSLTELIERARAFCNGDDTTSSAISHLARLTGLDQVTYDKKLLHAVIRSERPRVQVAAAKALLSNMSRTPLTGDDLRLLLLNRSPVIRRIAATSINSRITDFSPKNLEQLERLINDALTGPVLLTRGYEDRLGKAFCADCPGRDADDCSGDDGHVSMIYLLSTINSEPEFSDRLMTGQLQQKMPRWELLGIKGKEASITDLQPQLTPRKPGQSKVQLGPAHKRIAFALQNDLEIDEDLKQRFMRSLINIDYRLLKPPSVQNGIDWIVELTENNLNEFESLFGEFSNCRRSVWVPKFGSIGTIGRGEYSGQSNDYIRLAPGRFPYCSWSTRIRYFIDDKPIKALSKKYDRYWCADQSSEIMDLCERFQVRYPSPGVHNITTDLVVYNSYDKEKQITFRENRLVTVIDDSKESPPPCVSLKTAYDISKDFLIDYQNTCGPKLGSNQCIIRLKIDDPETRSFNLFYRLQAEDQNGKQYRVNGFLISDQYSDPSTLEIDMTSARPGVYRLTLDLIPEAKLAKSNESTRPYLNDRLRLRPIWVIRAPESVSPSWIDDLRRILRESEDPSLRGYCYHLLSKLGKPSQAAMPEVVHLLDDLKKWKPRNYSDRDNDEEIEGVLFLLRKLGTLVPNNRNISQKLTRNLRLLAPEPSAINATYFAKLILRSLIAMKARDAIVELKKIRAYMTPPRVRCQNLGEKKWHDCMWKYHGFRRRSREENEWWGFIGEALSRLGGISCTVGQVCNSAERVALVCLPGGILRSIELGYNERVIATRTIINPELGQSMVWVLVPGRDPLKPGDRYIHPRLVLYSVSDSNSSINRYKLYLQNGSFSDRHLPQINATGGDLVITAKHEVEDRLIIHLRRTDDSSQKWLASPNKEHIIFSQKYREQKGER